jgi:hypothetical protein
LAELADDDWSQLGTFSPVTTCHNGTISYLAISASIMLSENLFYSYVASAEQEICNKKQFIKKKNFGLTNKVASIM